VITFRQLGKVGRFGNQLWQVAATFGVANRLGRGVTLPAWEFERWFRFPQVFDGGEGEDVVALSGLSGSDAIYLQHLPLVAPIRGRLQEWLRPSVWGAEQVAGLRDVWKPAGATAVHVRRGDYAEAWRGHGMLDADWYRKVWPEGRVLVFSDDPGWCRENLPGEVVEVGPIQQWLLSAECKAHVISNSTFAWWAAYAAGGPTVYPTPWFTGLAYNDMFPTEWVEVAR
jgi:hypothetical protein